MHKKHMEPGIFYERWVWHDVGRDDADVPIHFPGHEIMVPDGKIIILIVVPTGSHLWIGFFSHLNESIS